jgi:small-conductance mechanosensitive channel
MHGGPPILILLPFLITFDDQFRDDAIAAALRIGVIVLVAFIGVWILQRILTPVIRVTITQAMKFDTEEEVQQRIDTLSHVIYRTAIVAVVIMVLLISLTEVGVNVAPLIAGLGLAGLAIGFGAQSLVKDMINGIFILMDNQYGRGDVVTIAGTTGIVEDINLRRTILRDLDGTVHFIPHSNVEVASNWTMEFSRINLDVGVAYESDLDQVIDVINRVGRDFAEEPEFKDKIRSAPHVLRVDNFGDSSIDIKVIGETVPLEQWALMGQLRLRLKKAFDEEGIVIPYPQRTLHLDTASALVGLVGQQAGVSPASPKPRESDGAGPGPETQPQPQAAPDSEEARTLGESPD